MSTSCPARSQPESSDQQTSGFLRHVYAVFRRQPWLYDIERDSMRLGYRRAAHLLLRIGARFLAVRYRVFTRWPTTCELKLNLGCGRRPLPDWINVDISPFSGAEVFTDLRDRWPFDDCAAQAIYTRHCFEHFSEDELSRIITQCYRVLAPGGKMRIGVPSLEVAVQKYREGDFQFAARTNRYQSPGRKFCSYITDKGNHKIMLDYGYLTELLAEAGFCKIVRMQGGTSGFVRTDQLAMGDCAEDWVTLYVECEKPKTAEATA